jgi:hypothetical protein
MIAWLPTPLGLVHVDQDAPATSPGPGLHWSCHTARVTGVKYGQRRPTVTSGKTRTATWFHLCKVGFAQERPCPWRARTDEESSGSQRYLRPRPRPTPPVGRR